MWSYSMLSMSITPPNDALTRATRSGKLLNTNDITTKSTPAMQNSVMINLRFLCMALNDSEQF